MARRQFGIRTIFLCTKGTLLTTPTNVVVGGYRGECDLVYDEEFNKITTVLNQALVNMADFKIETPSYQAKLEVLKNLLALMTAGADAQLISVPQTAGSVSSGGVFNFNGNNNPGVGFEFAITPKERSVKLMLELATYLDEALTIITQAGTNVPKDLSTYGSGAYGVSSAKRPAPIWVDATIGGTSFLGGRDELMDFKIGIKSKDSGKNAFNKDQVNYCSLNYEITGSDATISNIAAKLGISREAAVVITQKFDATNNDVFTFNAGVFGTKFKVDIGDQKGSLVISGEADIPLPDISITGVDPHAITFG